jgi:hypothetical protein
LPETKEIMQILISWPAAAIVSVLVLRIPIRMLVERLIKSESGKAKVGPVEIELGKLAEEGHQVIDDLNRISYIMAESRRLELEITNGVFSSYEAILGSVASPEQKEEMQRHIEELKQLTKAAANKANTPTLVPRAADLQR